jgi:acetylornithine/N-succinyldiaminopimelate aminotransferase
MKPYIVTKPAFPKNYADSFLQIDHGEGCRLFDTGGKSYLDFGSGIAVNALGYGREDLAVTAYDQMKKLIHISNLFTTEPTVALAGKLTGLGDFAAVHFGNSGSEANEAALKYARKYAKERKGPEAVGFISFSNGFHGRTMGSLSVTATEKYRKPFSPLLPGCTVLPFNDAEALKSFPRPEKTAAVIVEPVQGEGGLVSLSEEMIEALNSWCAENDVLIIADEVQTGMGRTGALLASEAAGLKADIVTLSKPLAGGLPLSATLIPAKVNDLVHPGDHGTTFGGGPVTCSVALKVLETVSSEGFLDEVAEKGEYLESLLTDRLAEAGLKGEVRGKGLLRGLVVEGLEPDKLPAIMNRMREEGLLVLRSGSNVLRMAPPLVISKNELLEGVEIIFTVIKEIL